MLPDDDPDWIYKVLYSSASSEEFRAQAKQAATTNPTRPAPITEILFMSPPDFYF
jgi:hypothetical protein